MSGAPDNAFCRLERGELKLSQVPRLLSLAKVHNVPQKFFPVFEREVEQVLKSRGLSSSRDFSSRQLFQRISSSVRPVPDMIRAVQLIKQAGQIIYRAYSICNIDRGSKEAIIQVHMHLS